MQVSNKTWHARWFQFVQSKIGSDYRYRNGTNICHYMRVTMFWGPLMILLLIGAVGFLSVMSFVLFLYAPFMAFGFLGPVVAVTGTAALVYLVTKLPWLFRKLRPRLAPVGSFAHIAIEHAIATKQRFCPLVSFGAPHSEPAE